MNTFWKAVIVLSALITAGNCLNCRQCSIGVFGSCFFGKDVTCANSTEACYSGDAQFNATGAIKLHTRGCLDTDLCGKTLTGSLLTAAYTASFTCCNGTNLCNGAAPIQLPVTATLCTAILSSLWGFWVL